MKGIYFLSLIFILILIIISFSASNKQFCLSQQFLYFGSPGLVREGFDIDAGRWKRYNMSIVDASPCYPYAQATHNPTNYAVLNEKKTWAFNEAVSEKMATTPPIGNAFTIYYPCRYSAISYKDKKYKDCSSYPANSCLKPILL